MIMLIIVWLMSILRARGGSSYGSGSVFVEMGYSPRTRR